VNTQPASVFGIATIYRCCSTIGTAQMIAGRYARSVSKSALTSSRSKTMRKDELLELARKCEEATGEDRGLDVEIARLMAVTVWLRNANDTANEETTYWRYTSSLDSALTLVPDGWAWMTGCAPGEGFFATLSLTDEAIEAGLSDTDMIDTIAATPALAFCAAALKALAQKEPTT
jgi:hypothetical protein